MTRLAAVAALAVLALLAGSAGEALAAAGDLDPSFDGDGKLILPFDGQPEATLVQPDGKIVLVDSYSSQNFTVRRLNSNGSLDKTFDGDGTAIADFGADDQVAAAALQPDGKIVVVGATGSSGTYYGAVARFDTGGALDASFDPGGADGDGKKVVSTLSGISTALVQDDGKIVLAGNYLARFRIVRLDTTGAPDGTTFEPADIGGLSSQYVSTAALAPDGRIVLGGLAFSASMITSMSSANIGALGVRPAKSRAAFAVYKPDGKLDTSFAGTGTLSLAPEVLASADVVLLQPDGKIVAAGMSNPADPRMTVLRLAPSGTPDDTFGAGGVAVADFEGEDDLTAAALAPDGKVLLAGTAGFPPGRGRGGAVHCGRRT